MRLSAESVKWLAVTFSYDGLISSISTSAEQLTGYSPQELVGKPVTHILADRSVFEITQMMDTARQWGSWEGEIVHRVRSGKSLDGRGSLSPMSGRQNANAGFSLVTIFNEVFEPAAHHDAMLRVISARLRMLAHELNNPLAVVVGFTQLILLNTACDGKIRAEMETLYSEIKRVIVVVEKIHSYAVSLQTHPPQQKNMSS